MPKTSLPDKLTDDELLARGFVKESENEAKHKRWNSLRHKCDSCGLWYKRLSSGVYGQYCKTCFRKITNLRQKGHYDQLPICYKRSWGQERLKDAVDWVRIRLESEGKGISGDSLAKKRAQIVAAIEQQYVNGDIERGLFTADQWREELQRELQ
ncbi:MAG TPA: hypothetical protein VFV34_19920 [Blastocatellia bacterium]|nr:hypothetical protein [Blastocatellia bacterium]